jgi:hypothetical protein
MPPFKFPFEWRANNLVEVLVTPEAEEFKMMQAQMAMMQNQPQKEGDSETATGGDNSGNGENANPGGVNQSTAPDGMGATSSFGTDGGMG